MQSLQIYPLCVCKGTTFFAIGKVFFKIYHEAREKLILVDRVNGIKITDTKFLKPNLSNVVFKIRGDLAKRYTLKKIYDVIMNWHNEVYNKGIR